MKKFIRGFVYAFNGLMPIFSELNMKVHFAISLLVIVFGFVFSISKVEWIVCLLSISLIFSLESINTAIERLCNHVTPEFNEDIKMIKDILAGAVLLAAVFVAIVGLIIFLPYLIVWVKSYGY